MKPHAEESHVRKKENYSKLVVAIFNLLIGEKINNNYARIEINLLCLFLQSLWLLLCSFCIWFNRRTRGSRSPWCFCRGIFILKRNEKGGKWKRINYRNMITAIHSWSIKVAHTTSPFMPEVVNLTNGWLAEFHASVCSLVDWIWNYVWNKARIKQKICYKIACVMKYEPY